SFLSGEKILEDQKEYNEITRVASRYTLIDVVLHKKGFFRPLLKCLRPSKVKYVLVEVYEGIYGHHLGEKALTQQIQQQWYYWP
ncbi:hypothetical protein E1A91_D05G294700v1, partial [Gossypium mustelinum]